MQAHAPRPRERLSTAARWNNFQRKYAPYIFISPFFILFLIFGLFPIVFMFYLSFQYWQPSAGLGTMEYVGLENYTDNLTDPAFWSSLKHTLSMALMSGIPQHLIAIPLAFAINTGLSRIKGPLTAVYFLPYITSVVAISVTFFTLFSWQYGAVNAALSSLHTLPLIGGLFPAEKINWLGERAFIQPAIAMVVVWRFTGWNVVLYLAGLQAIPKDLYEAAAVDGATKLRQFWHITLPLLRPTIFLAVTLTLIGNLQLFEEPFILTNGSGGPGQMGTTAVMYMLRTYQQYNEAGLAAAMAWLLFVVILVLTLINNRIFGRSGLAGRD
ncbi:carbohydrate ABC transporter permease [Deinococcus peraridilitoris]|uniref:Permease component of ABC-type sugar transporter n=1 Tax=Deinococcus peraridilitoris (strain DSM 19664 / LMG 22246 / CIP 109416 / KR-200) TaxID=937777 RepID=K9ZZM9_DEIPD|nr:sugar ABC transporter permease [Deinococcus peraridilitoris]AFZ66634.1 permease component of ABC-type sugar transporter [Deinococcus peraridilitoris DSM 19664]